MRSLRLLAVLPILLAAGVTNASAATYTWSGGSGNWHEAGHWIANPAAPGTIPGAGDDVVIPGPGTFTVTINSTAGEGALFSARSLTLGDNSAGAQELLIKTNADTAFGSGLALSQPSTIAPHGQVTIDQDPTTPAGSNQPYIEFDADSANQGTILARVQASSGNGTSVQGRGTLTNTGTLHVQSGTLTTKGLANSGAIVVDGGAFLHVSTIGDQSRGMAQSGGTITNNGELLSDGDIWHQTGGTLSGNPVEIANTGLDDSGGTGAFVLLAGNKLSGTIPSGQTVAIGKRDAEQTHSVQVQSGGVTVAPGGTLLLQGPPGNGLDVNSNPVIVDGTLRVAMPRTASSGGNDRAILSGGLVVHGGGSVDVQADSLVVLSNSSNPQSTYSNDGTISIAPGAELRLQLDSDKTLTNGSGATLNFGIASATRFGSINSAGGSIALGGTANGMLTDGFVPAAGTAFKVVNAHVASGTFATVGGGFTASYAADGSSASLVYGGGGGPVPDVTAPVLSKLKGSATKVSFTSSEPATVKLTITKSVAGRRVKGHCVKLRRANRKRPHCKRTVTVVKRTVNAKAGSSTVSLRRKLGAGHYRLRLTASDAAGNKAKPATKPFTVKAKPKRR